MSNAPNTGVSDYHVAPRNAGKVKMKTCLADIHQLYVDGRYTALLDLALQSLN